MSSFARPGNWPTATECSCDLVVGCGLSSSTHELGSAWHQCRQRAAGAGFEPAFSRVVGPAGFLFPTQRCAPTSLDVGAKKRLAVPCGIRELLCGNSGPCSAFHSHMYYVTVFGRIVLVQAAHSFRRVDDVLQQVFPLHRMQVAFGCPSADCSCRYWVAHLFKDVVC